MVELVLVVVVDDLPDVIEEVVDEVDSLERGTHTFLSSALSQTYGL